jgi:hypothetical protein
MIILELKLVTENYKIIYLVNRLSEFEKYINTPSNETQAKGRNIPLE